MQYATNEELYEAILELIKPLEESWLEEDDFREKCIDLVMEKMGENSRTAEILIDLAYAKEWLYETDNDLTFWIWRNKPFTNEEYDQCIVCNFQHEWSESYPYELELRFRKHKPIHEILHCLDEFWNLLDRE